ncbi:unnamed protein product, partial [Prorocentrum cordatum]
PLFIPLHSRWACSQCPCRKNAANTTARRHCGAPRADPGQQVRLPQGAWPNPQASQGAGGVHRPAPPGLQPPGQATQADIKDQEESEIEPLISMLKRSGNTKSADSYQRALAYKSAANKQQPMQQHINKAFNSLRASEDCLAKAVSKFVEMQAAVEEQRARVGRLQSECQQAEDLHKQLVDQLHAQVKSSDEPSPARFSPWSVRFVLVGT